MAHGLKEPMTLVLQENGIYTDSHPATKLYTVSESLTSVKHSKSSIKLYRVAASGSAELEASGIDSKPLFYLVHPLNADYRDDKPAYYLTSCSPGLGNIRLEASKSALPRITKQSEIRAFLSRSKSAEDEDLFAAKDDEELLFTVKSNWNGRTHTWVGADGSEAATSHRKDGSFKLSISSDTRQGEEVTDRLVATWALCLWRDFAERKEVKRDALERLTPAQPQGQGGAGDKMWKRTAALGGAAGGAG